MLVERNEQIARLVAFASGESPGAAFGSGRMAVISGPVASGKTALLHRVLEDRAVAGHRLLTAVGSPAEHAIPFGVMEQLLRDARQPAPGPLPPLLVGASVPGNPPSCAEPVATEVLQSFHAELGRTSAQGPVLIALDDVQYADPQSLHVLSYALRRFPATGAGAVSVIVTLGADARRTPPGALEELLHPTRGLHVRVGPLGVAGVERLLVERARGGEPGEDPAGTAPAGLLAGSLHAATGGNPLLVHGLVEDHFSHERPSAHPDDAGAADGSPHAGERFLRSALLIVHRVGADGLRVAQGIALLGSGAPLPLLARLVDVEERVVQQVASALADAGVLDGGRFRHAGVRAAVAESLDDEAVTRLRRRAARLLYEDGAPSMLVAEQLLGHDMSPPDEEWVPQVLVDAAREAMAAQRVGLAVSCLRMAEGRCRSERERAQVRIALTRIIWRVTPSAWPRQVRSLAGAVRAGQLPPVDALRLVGDLLWNGWVDDAVTAMRHVAAAVSQPDAELAAEVLWLRSVLASTFPEVLERVEATLSPLHVGAAKVPVSRADENRLAAAAALHGVLAGGTAGGTAGEGTPEQGADFADTADRILATLHLTEETEPTVQACLLTLVLADQLGTATQWADRLLAEATARWPASSTAILRAIRAQMALRHGHLEQARRLAEQALEELPPHCWGVGIGAPLSVLIEASTAMGDHEAAAELVGRPVPEGMLGTRYGLQYLYARGRHELETGRPYAALTDFTTCGRLMRRWGMDRSTLAPWRVGVAEAWLALGSRDQVEHFAREQLAADAGPRVRGTALRALAAARPVGERPPLLSEAVALLQADGDWYELARALTDLGQAHKQLGDPVQSKLHTRRAWRIAEGCGARKLRRSLQSEQAPGQAAPKEPERAQPAAAAALTDAERRVASLAAQGYTNREIGAKLFITVSTVEQHLTRVYRKINISHRRDLPVSLDLDVAHIA
ncbi:helix-turn-helix transcriptional regulator [Actinacidiphila glaucinigra]|uniref:Regulatory protein, luxR family n=1 Tax=Actinacidiphila glaucinigra TaxID=235986 RepID=A0A239IVD5_9ACTN|nr:LuxR family transcriptional regulator [Actinacidiphila glaucinigra]SNS97736.1 regulatory protein, luxR family [Actinacidiphila glaucinigra]